MTLVSFILWCVAIYLGVTVALPLVIFLLSSLVLGATAIFTELEERRKQKEQLKHRKTR